MANTYNWDVGLLWEDEDPNYRAGTPQRLRAVIDLMRSGKKGRAKRELLEMEPVTEEERRERNTLLLKLGHDVDGLERFLKPGVSDKEIGLARESTGNDPYYGQKPGLTTPRQMGKVVAAIIAVGLVVGTCVARGDSEYQTQEPAPIYETLK